MTIWASRTECTQTLQENMFNDALWPDFTRIPSAKKPVLQLKAFKPGATFKAGPYKVTLGAGEPPGRVAVASSSQTGGTALAISGDTGPTDRLWEVLNGTPNLKALLLETSFPNELQDLADLSGHLTPRTLRTS